MTLWALTQRTKDILVQLGDKSETSDCTLLFRPSFGRSGGSKSSQFGEFDFILATPYCLYLGEAKWDQSPELIEDVIRLRKEQIERHKIFSAYYQVWISAERWEWPSFLEACQKRFSNWGIEKPLPHSDSLLSQNLRTILELVTDATRRTSNVRNVLLVVDSRGILSKQGKKPPAGFDPIMVDSANERQGSFIPIKIG